MPKADVYLSNNLEPSALIIALAVLSKHTDVRAISRAFNNATIVPSAR